MTVNMQQFYQVFFDESEELLAQMEALLLDLDIQKPNPEDLNAIFRAAHSIKGGAGTFGFDDLINIAHALESLLDKFRRNELSLNTEHIDAFLLAKDALTMILAGHRHNSHVDRNMVKNVEMTLSDLASRNDYVKSHGRDELNGKNVFRQFQVDLAGLTAKDKQVLKDELSIVGKVEEEDVPDGTRFIIVTTEPAHMIYDTCSFIVDDDGIRITEISEIAIYDEGNGYGFFEPIELLNIEEGDGYGFFISLPSTTELTPTSVNSYKHIEQQLLTSETKVVHGDTSSSIRVSIDKVDDLINLVGELVITEAMIEACASSLDHSQHTKLLSRISQLARNTRALQESVMSIRMMPMDYVFSRFPRMVRDLAGKLGKNVELVTYGASTELDKGLIERIIDPLTHIIRNSIDHGIELPALRSSKGKSPHGRIMLSANHVGGHIVIEVSDDGAGLQKERILNKAKQQHLSIPNDATDEEVWQLIFEPGFSTADEVTDVSGRGVGMDVVRRNIHAMGGSVDIESAAGFGTTITISVPLTLAILDGMSIKLDKEVYILPLNYVVESVHPNNSVFSTICQEGKVVKIRDQYLPVVALRDYFGVDTEQRDISQSMLVIVESDSERCALLVDELVGQQQVVVKNLETNYRRVKGISGATILGDGSVSLIVDINSIVKAHTRDR